VKMSLSNPNDLPLLDRLQRALLDAGFWHVTEEWSDLGLAVGVEAAEDRRSEFEALVRTLDPLSFPEPSTTNVSATSGPPCATAESFRVLREEFVIAPQPDSPRSDWHAGWCESCEWSGTGSLGSVELAAIEHWEVDHLGVKSAR
jgi:hypothetical protein